MIRDLMYLIPFVIAGGATYHKLKKSGVTWATVWQFVAGNGEKSLPPWLKKGVFYLGGLWLVLRMLTPTQPPILMFPPGTNPFGARDPSLGTRPKPVAKRAPKPEAESKTETKPVRAAMAPPRSTREAEPPPALDAAARLEKLLPAVSRPPLEGTPPGTGVLFKVPAFEAQTERRESGSLLVAPDGKRVVVVIRDDRPGVLLPEAGFLSAFDALDGRFLWANRLLAHEASVYAKDQGVSFAAVLTHAPTLGNATALNLVGFAPGYTFARPLFVSFAECALFGKDRLFLLSTRARAGVVAKDLTDRLHAYYQTEPMKKDLSLMNQAGVHDLRQITLPVRDILAADFIPKKEVIVTGGSEGVQIWPPYTRPVYPTFNHNIGHPEEFTTPKAIYQGHSSPVRKLLSHSKTSVQTYILSVAGPEIHIFGIDGTPHYQTTLPGEFTSVDVSQDWRLALTGDAHGTVTLWDIATGTSLETFSTDQAGGVLQCALGHDGTRAYALTGKGMLFGFGLPQSQ